ncbi:hypothetical protein ACPFL9_20460 [Paenarthrobacter sp. NyZ202]|uniref:hypothetical protein n=1 Tax=Paenarthrobacter sp. NyZ202 TaxID=3402689 RepID=UPI003CF0B10A
MIGLLVVIVGLGLLRWLTLSEPRYFWPKKAEDWSAWGTCLGAIGTILAVVYAARTFKSTSQAQLEERQDRRAEMSFIEAREAAEAIKLRPNVNGIALRGDEHGGSFELKGALIYVENRSDHAFHDVQVYVPPTSLKEGVTLSNFKFFEAPFEWEYKADESREPKRGTWADMPAPAPPIPDSNLFTLGTVEPGKARSVMFDFEFKSDDLVEDTMKWGHKPRASADEFGREVLLVISFTDRNGRTWERTSHDGGKIKRVRHSEATL